VITAASGLGLLALFAILSLHKPDVLLMAGPALVVFFIGLGIMLNGLLFTIKKTSALLAGQDQANSTSLSGGLLASSSKPARPSFLPSSVADQTTRHLSSELTNQKNGDSN
jgi:hypothetical protein